jgi:PAS domain S-box-containing protein
MTKASRKAALRAAQISPALVIYLDPRLRILFANGHCERLLGYTSCELQGRELADIVDPATLRYARRHAASIERNGARSCEYVLRHKDGSSRRCRVHAIADRDEQGKRVGYFACTSDGSEERAARAAERLREAKQMLALELDGGERPETVRRLLTTHVGRELRTPLASIIAALELLREGLDGELRNPEDSFVGLALENAERLSALIERLTGHATQ